MLADWLIVIVPVGWCWLMAAICVAVVAGHKGREPAGWFCYALLMWPVAHTHALMAEPIPVNVPENRGRRTSVDRSAPDQTPGRPQNEHAIGDNSHIL